jgi:hypothetical protein
MVVWEMQEGATKEDIEQLSKFKFQRTSNEKLAGNTQGPVGGIMIECQADSPIEHVLADEDAVCCKFLLCAGKTFSSPLTQWSFCCQYYFNIFQREIHLMHHYLASF